MSYQLTNEQEFDTLLKEVNPKDSDLYVAMLLRSISPSLTHNSEESLPTQSPYEVL